MRYQMLRRDHLFKCLGHSLFVQTWTSSKIGFNFHVSSGSDLSLTFQSSMSLSRCLSFLVNKSLKNYADKFRSIYWLLGELVQMLISNHHLLLQTGDFHTFLNIGEPFRHRTIWSCQMFKFTSVAPLGTTMAKNKTC